MADFHGGEQEFQGASLDGPQRQGLASLGQELERMGGAMARLTDAIEQLQAQHQGGEWAPLPLSPHQEVLIEAIAREVAAQIQGAMDAQGEPVSPLLAYSRELQATLGALEREIKDHQGALSQQLSRMQSLEQQGEAILATLVVRLNRQLQITTAQIEGLKVPPGATTVPLPRDRARGTAPPSPDPAFGFWLVSLALVLFGLSYVGLRVLLRGEEILGIPWGIRPSLGSLAGILGLRCFVGLPFSLVATLGGAGHGLPLSLQGFPPLSHRSFWQGLLGNTLWLWGAHLALGGAIAHLPTGVAVTLFFLYPLPLYLGRWWLRGDRPQGWVALLCLGLGLGGGLVLPWGAWSGEPFWGRWGAGALGIAAGGCFAMAHGGGQQYRGVAWDMGQGLALTVFSAMVFGWPWGGDWGLQGEGGVWFLVGSLALGALGGGGYFLQHQGRQRLGGGRTLACWMGLPLVTTALADLLLQETLAPLQGLGVLLVALAGTGLALVGERRSPGPLWF